jgi:predicted RNA-binding protein with PIN domain
VVKLDLLTLVDKLTPVLVVIIPSYFSFKSTKTTKEADKRIEGLLNKIDTLGKSVQTVETIGKDNNQNLTMIGKGLQRLQRFRLQENLKKALNRGYTNQHEIEELSKLYESYVELGGNGAIKVLFERFLNLEIKEEN